MPQQQVFKAEEERGFLFPKLDLYIALINSKSVSNGSDSILVRHPGERAPAGVHVGQWNRTLS